MSQWIPMRQLFNSPCKRTGSWTCMKSVTWWVFYSRCFELKKKKIIKKDYPDFSAKKNNHTRHQCKQMLCYVQFVEPLLHLQQNVCEASSQKSLITWYILFCASRRWEISEKKNLLLLAQEPNLLVWFIDDIEPKKKKSAINPSCNQKREIIIQ